MASIILSAIAITAAISGTLHAAFPDLLSILTAIFLYGDVASAAVAGAGIYWETKHNGSEFEKFAQRCVLYGVIFETLFSVLLFIVDGHATAAAVNDAAKANEKAAALTRQVGLRHLDGDKFLAVLGDGPKGEYEIEYGAEDPDSILLAFDLKFLSARAGWKFIDMKATPLAQLLANWMIFPKNIKIEVHAFEGHEIPILTAEAEVGNKLPRTLFSVLSGAILMGLGGIQNFSGGVDPSLPENRIRIIVYPR